MTDVSSLRTLRDLSATWRTRAALNGAIYAQGIEECADDLDAARAALLLDEPEYGGEGSPLAERDPERAFDEVYGSMPELAAALSQETPAPAELRAFADRLWHRWQAEKLGTGSDHLAYTRAVDNELKDMQPPKGSQETPRWQANTTEHRCGVRGFANSGDTCPGCVAGGRVSLPSPPDGAR